MTFRFSKINTSITLGTLLGFPLIAGAAFTGPIATQEMPLRFADQGPDWTPEIRAALYVQDQGSQLIPLAWFKALRQADGKSFGENALARYGYLPNPSPANPENLPAGFSLANSQQGPMVGLSCAACHTRQINVDGTAYRIDGGPAFADFQSFIVDLDEAVLRVLKNGAAFKTFAVSVLGAEANKPEAVTALHEAIAFWSLRFHTIISRSVPTGKPWGPGRLDAIAMIYNRLNGLDLGPAPTYMLPDNMAIADAPARYPFLWNAGRQDKTQWGGWAGNGSDGLALARNLGQVIGVFAAFRPEPKAATTVLDRDYLSANSANIMGLATAEGLLTRLRPPVWPFAVDHALAEHGREVFNRPAAEGGCAECHGLAAGEPRPSPTPSLRTVVADAGTDLHQWQIVLRQAKTGTLEGATVPGVVGPLRPIDLSLNTLKAVVTGTLFELQAAQGSPSEAVAAAPPAVMSMTHMEMEKTMQVPGMKMPEMQIPAKAEASPAAAPAAPPPGTFVYEARALQGIWAAPPYLHNGSVPSLTELLKPAAQRVKAFKAGPNYDTKTVGLATDQATGFTLQTTGCEDRNSGNSNCGHDYGTQLPDNDKAALIEYLKTF